jgi:hypothetical protein
MKRHLRLFVTSAVLAVLGAFFFSSSVLAQSEAGRVAFGANFGLSKYWGSFTDNQFWQGGDIYLRWNIIPFISFHAQFGVSQLRYKISDDNLKNNPATSAFRMPMSIPARRRTSRAMKRPRSGCRPTPASSPTTSPRIRRLSPLSSRVSGL